jgi:hypothetical protein
VCPPQRRQPSLDRSGSAAASRARSRGAARTHTHAVASYSRQKDGDHHFSARRPAYRTVHRTKSTLLFVPIRKSTLLFAPMSKSTLLFTLVSHRPQQATSTKEGREATECHQGWRQRPPTRRPSPTRRRSHSSRPQPPSTPHSRHVCLLSHIYFIMCTGLPRTKGTHPRRLGQRQGCFLAHISYNFNFGGKSKGSLVN